MTERDVAAALAQFDAAIAKDISGEAPFHALRELTQAVTGFKLFTVMIADHQKEESRRAYTSDPVTYPTSGSKPFNYGPWFDRVHKERKPFVANTIGDIAKVLFDHEVIWSLGCGSIINLPVVINDVVVGAVNVLHEEHYYTPERLETHMRHIAIPAKLAMLAYKGD